MSSAAEERRERHRVLLLFGFTTLPPLILLSILAAVAVRNDGHALRYLQQEQARQAAEDAKRGLETAIDAAEEAAFGAVDVAALRGGDAEALVEAVEQAAVAWDQRRCVFDADITLDGRFDQIADLSADAGDEQQPHKRLWRKRGQ